MRVTTRACKINVSIYIYIYIKCIVCVRLRQPTVDWIVRSSRGVSHGVHVRQAPTRPAPPSAAAAQPRGRHQYPLASPPMEFNPPAVRSRSDPPPAAARRGEERTTMEPFEFEPGRARAWSRESAGGARATDGEGRPDDDATGGYAGCLRIRIYYVLNDPCCTCSFNLI